MNKLPTELITLIEEFAFIKMDLQYYKRDPTRTPKIKKVHYKCALCGTYNPFKSMEIFNPLNRVDKTDINDVCKNVEIHCSIVLSGDGRLQSYRNHYRPE